MNLYLIGNSTCANRGDSAILRGLINVLESDYPQYKLRVVSRFPNAARLMLDREVTADIPYRLNRSSGGLMHKLTRKIKEQLRYEHLYLMLKYSWYRKFFSIPQRYSDFLKDFDQADAIFQVGGSFFIDLYGVIQYEALMVLMLSDKPVFLVGHSLGPFQNKRVNRFASLVFSKAAKIYLREGESYKELETLNSKLDNVTMGADTAWTLPEYQKTEICEQEINNEGRPIIGFTFRNLKPFDVRLGVTQEAYEQKMVTLINKLIEDGYQIVALSMCTGLDGYPVDDRIIANSIKNKIDKPERMDLLLYEYNELQLGYIMSKCDLLIGTRLHSVIIALRYNIPAIAVYYEHKSLGILTKLGLEDHSIRIHELDSSKVTQQIHNLLRHREDAKAKIIDAVRKEQESVKTMIRGIINTYETIK